MGDYTLIVPPRVVLPVVALLLLLAGTGALAAQEKAEPPEPPEEDERLAPKEYTFNPIQARRELEVGNFYFRKGSYQAAVGRYLEATKWNPGYAEAYRRLGEAYERLKAFDQAREAYRKFLELVPEGREASQIRKRLERLPASGPKESSGETKTPPPNGAG